MTNTDNPKYYAGEIECWDTIWQLDGPPGCLAHMRAYLWRCGKKPGASMQEDLAKLRNWTDFLLRKLEGEE